MAIEHISITCITSSNLLPAAALWPVLTFTTGGVSEVEQLREQLVALQRQVALLQTAGHTPAAAKESHAAASTEAASAPAASVVPSHTLAPTVHWNADVTGNGPRGGSYDGKAKSHDTPCRDPLTGKGASDTWERLDHFPSHPISTLGTPFASTPATCTPLARRPARVAPGADPEARDDPEVAKLASRLSNLQGVVEGVRSEVSATSGALRREWAAAVEDVARRLVEQRGEMEARESRVRALRDATLAAEEGRASLAAVEGRLVARLTTLEQGLGQLQHQVAVLTEDLAALTHQQLLSPSPSPSPNPSPGLRQ